MKKTLLLLLLASGLMAYGVDPPKFLNGINYTIEQLTTEDGEGFTCYTIKNKEDWEKMNERFNRMGRIHSFVQDGIVFGWKRSGDWEILRSWAWGFRQFRIYEVD